MKKHGFTLIEIMIVVVIAVSVAAFAVPAYKKSLQRNQFLAAEGKLIEIASGLRNVMQMFRADSCPSGSPSSSETNADGTLNQKGCNHFPQSCLFKNGYTKSNLNPLNGYSFSINDQCTVCMSGGGSGPTSPLPSKVCIDSYGCETRTYQDGTYETACEGD